MRHTVSTKLDRVLQVRRNHSRNGQRLSSLIDRLGRDTLSHARHEGAGIGSNEVDLLPFRTITPFWCLT
jgi:hypothetical protein